MIASSESIVTPQGHEIKFFGPSPWIWPGGTLWVYSGMLIHKDHPEPFMATEPWPVNRAMTKQDWIEGPPINWIEQSKESILEKIEMTLRTGTK